MSDFTPHENMSLFTPYENMPFFKEASNKTEQISDFGKSVTIGRTSVLPNYCNDLKRS